MKSNKARIWTEAVVAAVIGLVVLGLLGPIAFIPYAIGVVVYVAGPRHPDGCHRRHRHGHRHH